MIYNWLPIFRILTTYLHIVSLCIVHTVSPHCFLFPQMLLFTEGCDIDCKDEDRLTPLHEACQLKQSNVAKYLVGSHIFCQTSHYSVIIHLTYHVYLLSKQTDNEGDMVDCMWALSKIDHGTCMIASYCLDR